MPIKAITFDFWSTLYQTRTIDYAERIRKLKTELELSNGHKLGQEQFEAAVKVARESWNRTWLEQQRTMAAAEWLAILIQELDLAVARADLARIQTRMENSILTDTPIMAPEAQAVLADLSAHYRLAIISDTGLTPGRVLRQILEADGLAAYFTHLTFSDEVGRSKPHPEPFRATLGALAAEPAAAVHVGDLLRTDIAGAKAIGMRAVQYVGLKQDSGIIPPDIPIAASPAPDAIISNHQDLKPLLKQWQNST